MINSCIKTSNLILGDIPNTVANLKTHVSKLELLAFSTIDSEFTFVSEYIDSDISGRQRTQDGRPIKSA